MANAEQLAIVRQGVEVWNAWRSQNNRSIAPDFTGADLTDIDLVGADLFRVIFTDANLTGTIFTKINAQWSDFQSAKLADIQWDEANLYGSDFSDADLQRANLHRAFLDRTTFQKANLRRSDLRRVYMRQTKLRGINLQEANLTGAILQGADLQEANLTGAILQGADIEKAFIGKTIFGNVDLREVQGLELVQHRSPSIIGIDALYNSQGNIPDIFLRGCGVPEPMIEYARSLVAANNPIQFYSVFISYSHADASFARRLHDALQGRGIRCWLDEHQLLPGHSIYDEIDRGIRLWDKILLCASESSLKSWWVDNEIDKAFTKEQQLMQERGTKIRALIPLNLDNALWQWQDGKANQVRSRLAADFTGWEHDNAKFEREFERLVRALRTDEGREVPPPARL